MDALASRCVDDCDGNFLHEKRIAIKVPDSAKKLLRERTQVRRVFTRTAKKEILTKVDYDCLHEKATTLTTLDKVIYEIILSDSKFSKEDFEKKYDDSEEYQEK